MSTRPENHRVARYDALTAKPCAADYGLAMACAIIGSTLAPNNLRFKDESAPFEGELCDCHAAGHDHIIDLRMKFKAEELVKAFELDEEPSGVDILLRVTGTLNDGSPFVGSDCVFVLR